MTLAPVNPLNRGYPRLMIAEPDAMRPDAPQRPGKTKVRVNGRSILDDQSVNAATQEG
jgi:hypothetical protein